MVIEETRSDERLADCERRSFAWRCASKERRMSDADGCHWAASGKLSNDDGAERAIGEGTPALESLNNE